MPCAEGIESGNYVAIALHYEPIIWRERENP